MRHSNGEDQVIVKSQKTSLHLAAYLIIISQLKINHRLGYLNQSMIHTALMTQIFRLESVNL